MAPIEVVEVPHDIHQLYHPPSVREKYGLGSFCYEVKPPSEVAASIEWRPSREAYYRRLFEQTALTNGPSHDLPPHWPRQLKSPLAWAGQDLCAEGEYVYQLRDEDLKEILQALMRFKSLGLDYSGVKRETFPLPQLGPILKRLSVELHEGKGFFVVRGLQPQTFDDDENLIVYLGLSSYIAERRARMDTFGRVVYHVTAAPTAVKDGSEWQPIFSNDAQPFHADVGPDVLAFYTTSVAQEGGDQLLASSWTVYNILSQRRPDHLAELASADWAHNTFGRFPPFFHRPLLFYTDDKVVMNYSRRMLTGNNFSPLHPSSPPITIAQANALDAVEFTAQECQLRIKNVAGDMIFINNFAILHARDGYQDGPAGKRHILRLWLRNDELGWQIPPGLRLQWDTLFTEDDNIPTRWDPTPEFDLPASRNGKQSDGDPSGGGNGGGSGGGGGGGSTYSTNCG